MDTDGASLFWFLALGVVAPAMLAALPSGRRPRGSCDGGPRPAASRSRPATMRRSARTWGTCARFRALASLPFWWLGAARFVLPSFPEALSTYTIPVLVYVAGALVAELTFARRSSRSTVKHASLIPRSVRDYQPDWIRCFFRVPWCHRCHDNPAGAPLRGRPWVGAARSSASAPAAVVALLAESSRRVVKRPQRVGDIDVLVADDGLRATADLDDDEHRRRRQRDGVHPGCLDDRHGHGRSAGSSSR